jgi:hypothetical protein
MRGHPAAGSAPSAIRQQQTHGYGRRLGSTPPSTPPRSAAGSPLSLDGSRTSGHVRASQRRRPAPKAALPVPQTPEALRLADVDQSHELRRSLLPRLKRAAAMGQLGAASWLQRVEYAAPLDLLAHRSSSPPETPPLQRPHPPLTPPPPNRPAHKLVEKRSASAPSSPRRHGSWTRDDASSRVAVGWRSTDRCVVPTPIPDPQLQRSQITLAHATGMRLFTLVAERAAERKAAQSYDSPTSTTSSLTSPDEEQMAEQVVGMPKHQSTLERQLFQTRSERNQAPLHAASRACQCVPVCNDCPTISACAADLRSPSIPQYHL